MSRLVRTATGLLARHPILIPLVLGVALACIGLGIPLMLDDFLHYKIYRSLGAGHDASIPLGARDHLGGLSLFQFVSPTGQAPGFIEHGELPWWSSADIKIRFWRPLSSYLGYVDYLIAGSNPRLAHLHSALWVGVCITAAGLLFRRLASPKLAGLALLVFALDDSHWSSSLWLAGRSAVISSSFAFLACYAYIRARRGEGRYWLALALPLAGLALLSAESGLAGLAYILSFEVTELLQARGGHTRTRHIWPASLFSLLPIVVVIMVWLSVYRAGGYGVSGSTYYVHVFAEPLQFILQAPAYLLTGIGHLFAPIPGDLYAVPALRPLLVIQGIVVCAVLLWALRKVVPTLTADERLALTWLGIGAVFSFAPGLSVMPGSRVLYPPSLGSSFVIALLIRHTWRHRTKRSRALACAALCGLHLLLAPLTWLGLGQMQAQHASQAMAVSKAAAKDLQITTSSRVVQPIATDPPLVFMPAILDQAGLSYPEHWLPISTVSADHILTRPGADSLELRVADGQAMSNSVLCMITRRLEERFEVGQIIKRKFFDYQVAEVNETGQVTRIALNFPQTLEDYGLQLVVWRNGKLQELPLPAVGSETLIEHEPGIAGF